MIRELFQYQAHADTSMLVAIQRHEVASKDHDILVLVHHMLVAHRFWIYLCQRIPFSVEAENVPGTLDDIAALFDATQTRELPWMERLEDADLEQTVESPFLPGREITIRQALTQVCLHSQGHRAQLAVRLRALGGEPPPVDYILWIKDRPSPSWS